MIRGTGRNRMSMTELAPADVWRNKIYSGGWKTGGAGTIPVTEKATGAEMGSIGCASAADGSAARAIATDAQRAWAPAPALATGNAVLLKPDPQTPVSGGVLYARLFEAAGLPEGLFHVLPGGAETGDALVRDPLVNMISFTGSTRVGQEIGAVAGGLLKRASLELGGKNPYIVLDDVDVEAAASAGAWGSFLHQGQVCMSAGRHLVHESIADAYIESLVRRTRALSA